jgi:hypothetical protein
VSRLDFENARKVACRLFSQPLYCMNAGDQEVGICVLRDQRDGAFSVRGGGVEIAGRQE